MVTRCAAFVTTSSHDFFERAAPAYVIQAARMTYAEAVSTGAALAYVIQAARMTYAGAVSTGAARSKESAEEVATEAANRATQPVPPQEAAVGQVPCGLGPYSGSIFNRLFATSIF